MSNLKRIYAWCKKYSILILFSLGILLVLVFKILTRNSSNESEVIAKINLGKIKEEVIYLEHEKKDLAQKIDRDEDRIVKVDGKLREIDVKILQKKERIRELPLEEKLEEFDRLGY